MREIDTAIIGVSCRFPGADNSKAFWGNLVANKSAVSEIPKTRWDWAEFWGDPKQEKNKSHSKWGAFLKDVDAFDNEFFELLPQVAETMDPQQRIMLELVWTCFEDAGIAPSSVANKKVGVVFGIFNHDYKELQESGNFTIKAHHSTGTAAAIIANRVSHFFGLRGPSIPVDTACSSSINAIHSAIQSIRSGDCEIALAGGINLLLTPTRHISFSQMGMLSPTGSCKTFDANADGYVRGEGAGVVLLKPLDKAIADGDSIYGIIKGTAVNHCGKTYTLTYPSPQAQAEVISEAINRAEVPIESISYIEAHGTGTPKGDPIEFEGLREAFNIVSQKQQVTLKPHFCALGSVKTNIGHLEAAAGIAGVIKVLMAFKNKQLPALHHYKTLNPRIKHDSTPFYFLDSLRDWEQPKASDEGSYYPLRAGVSSFGFGGTNAHVILEEGPRLSQTELGEPSLPGYLICLSAKTKDALLQKKHDLAAWCKQDNGTTSLLSISSTLLTGRDHFAWRLAFIAHHHDELLSYLELEPGAADAPVITHCGDSDEEESGLNSDLDNGIEFLSSLKAGVRFERDDYLASLKKLSAAYLEGNDLDWKLLYSGYSIMRAHLPAYPFTKARFWIHREDGDLDKSTLPQLHPLLHCNVSNLEKQCFRSNFKGKEFFLADHKVKDKAVLPGVAYLEMARQALEESIVSWNEVDNGTTCLNNVVWVRPITVSKDTPVLTSVYPGQSGQSSGLHTHSHAHSRNNGAVVDFEITSDGIDGDSTVLYCRGTASKTSNTESFTRDLPVISNGTERSAEECYTILKRLGLVYGEGHQSIRRIQFQGGQCEINLKLPQNIEHTLNQYVIHPSMADAALQAAVLLVSGGNDDLPLGSLEEASPYLPFALDQIRIHQACAGEMSAWVRFSEGSGHQSDMKKLDIDLYNVAPDGVKAAQAKPAFQLKGLHLRQMASATKEQSNIQQSAQQAVQQSVQQAKKESALFSVDNREGFYTPVWVEAPTKVTAKASLQNVMVIGEQDDVNSLLDKLQSKPHYAQTNFIKVNYADEYAKLSKHHYLVRPELLESNNAILDDLKRAGVAVEHVLHLASNGEPDMLSVVGLGDGLDKGARGLFAFTKSLMKRAKRVRFVTLVQGQKGQFKPLSQGLSGFYKTVKLEKPAFNGRVVLCDWQGDAGQVAQCVFNELCSEDKDTDIVYEGETRFIRSFVPAGQRDLELVEEANKSEVTESISYKVGGVYLITGGAGALGLIFARYISEKYQGTVYLTGRSSPDEKKQAVLDEITALGGQANYIACDVASAQDVAGVVQAIQDNGQHLHGIIHAAGVIEDNFLLRKTPETFERVIQPKTYGTVNLDLATLDQPLDFFITFSSVTGVLGNLGQCDYGFGNAFEDYYSHYRASLQAQGKRNGKSLSVNWPYWREGGMTLTDKEEGILRRNFGIVPLENNNGLRALEMGLKSKFEQLAVLEACDEAKVHQVLGVISAAPQAAQSTLSVVKDTPSSTSTADLKKAAVQYLIALFSKEINMPASRFQLDASFQQYGFDSVVMIDLVNALEKHFTGLPKTLFFEYQTLNELGTFFAENYPDQFSRQTQSNSNVISVAKNTTPERIEYNAKPRSRFFSGSNQQNNSADNKIAIIGVAGRYPEAENLAAYWNNLKSGRDCIREIPAARWSIDTMYQPGAATLGKSYSKWGGFLKDIDTFDPLFFSISPKEAELMDPHERLFLETVANTIADAGYHPSYLAHANGVKENPVGVYVGVMWGDYQLHGVENEDPSTWTPPRSFYWAVANRVSYVFDFSGPSITIDTACASSITAIHLACDALRRGEIQTAIAGGVNLSVHPNKYNMLSNMQFLSSDGRCRSFGEGGDGYVPGEGVGAVVLKPLSDAVRDGDHIYGVIRGSAVNHGGKTSGFTVPNPNRQAAMIRDALDSSGTDPRHISYLEAHGTGTSLGDPIELAGLTKAFAQQEKQYCPIGSAKSNIGHLEASAGIAGLTKVLLQMKHKTLVPTLHSETVNPYLDFENSPFYLQHEVSEWKRPIIESEHGHQELPRIAGISSFGAGGSNAHLIIEEYSEDLETQSGPEDNLDTPVLITLSAKREEPLKKMASALLDHIQHEQGLCLSDIAFTLQTGRIALECRLAIVTKSLADLAEKLRAYLAGTTSSITDIYQDSQANATSALQVDEQALLSSLQNNELTKLAAMWAQGANCDWHQLPRNGHCRRTPLPGYAFNKQRYWTDKPVSKKGVNALHPLIDSNISTLDEQAFQKTFSGAEFYLQDHRLGDAKVLPGVAYLEMAIQAAQLASRGELVKSLNDIAWLKPIVKGEGEETARVSLSIGDQKLNYEIYGLEDNNKTVFSTGWLDLVEPDQQLEIPAFPLDIAQIQARSTRQDRPAIEAGFKAKGFNIGPSFRVFDYLFFNDNEALAHLTLANEQQTTKDQFVLHPALLDAALRTSVAIGEMSRESGLPVPIKLQRVDIYRELTGSCLVYAKQSNQHDLQAQQQCFDIAILNEQGDLLVTLSGLVTQTLANASIFTPKSTVRKPAQAAPIREPKVVASVAKNNERVGNVIAVIFQQSREDTVKVFLANMISKATKIPADQVDSQAAFDSYGIDSVMILAMNEELAATFGDDISKTLFFECRSLNELVDYFLENHAEEIDAKLNVTTTASPLSITTQPVVDTPAAPEIVAVQNEGALDEQALHSAVVPFLTGLISEETKLPVEQVDVNGIFESYGIDSVMILKFNEKLEAVFGNEVSKTLFFEFSTISELAEYFVENFASKIQLELATAVVPSGTNVPAVAIETEVEDCNLKETVENYLLHVFNTCITPSGLILDVDSEISQIGLDPQHSVAITHNVQQYIKRFTSSAIYEYPTISKLADHLLMATADSVEQLSQLPQGNISSPSGGNATSADTQTPSVSASNLEPKRFSLQNHRFNKDGGDSASLQHQDVAIIGLSGRYPKANTLEEYWENLVQGRDCITEIPASRWDYRRYFNPDREAKNSSYSKWGGFVEDIDQFDAQLFNISRRWAEIIDPQARQFLHATWQCLEDAAYTRKSLSNKSVGVFAGVMWGHYDQLKVSKEQKQYGRPWVSFASVANRVSYFFDFHGPSMTMDTMCSSSLTAIHQACLSMRNGDCDVALAGGVNLQTAPEKYLTLSQGQFVSTDGRCRSFGEGGDGYVPGEGIGVALLKPLSRAVQDGDHIYGVIKGMALNHGGRTNGYTVPNQTAQTNVIGKALDRANWHPETIDYIEAHGTGTSLGDPIEIASTTKAFSKRFSNENKKDVRQYCRIGSVKSNIGHLESAAGIAALTKVLLQFKHKTIAPSLHSRTLNPHINFNRTPFRVIQDVEPWNDPVDHNGKRLPRRAGISSFGAGGSNAHLLVEEYLPATQQPEAFWSTSQRNTAQIPGIFVLSADTKARLSRYVDRMISFLKAQSASLGKDKQTWFYNFLYTSQVGRESMAERLAVVASNVDELISALESYGTDDKSNSLYLGNVSIQSDKLESIIDRDSKDTLINSMLGKQQTSQLARAWVSYLDIDWVQHTETLFPHRAKHSLQRIPMPTMPFVTQRYWVDEAKDDDVSVVQALHPLIDINQSTLLEQRYTKTFTGKEFYLQDHVIGLEEKQVILPGVAYLEMARAAGSMSMSEDFRVQRLCNLMWVQPIQVEDDPRKVYIRLDQRDDSVSFDVLSKIDSSAATLAENTMSHCQGEIYYLPASIERRDEHLDISDLKANAIAVEHQAQIYEAFEQMGFCYGPSFRVTDTRYRLGDSALCKLNLPQHLVHNADNFYIHPSLMDAALRTCLGIGQAEDVSAVPIVPFALEEMEIRAPLTHECYAYAYPGGSESGTLKKYHLIITDSTGKVLIKLHNFVGRELIKPSNNKTQINYFDFHWRETSINKRENLSPSDTLLVIGGDSQSSKLLAQKTKAKTVTVKFGNCFADLGDRRYQIDPTNKHDYLSLVRHLHNNALWPTCIVYAALNGEENWNLSSQDILSPELLNVTLDHGVYSLLFLFQALEQVNPQQSIRCVFAYRGVKDTIYPQYDGLSALAKSLLVSNHRFELMTLCVDGSESKNAIAGYVLDELVAGEPANGIEIKYQQRQRLKRQIAECKPQVQQTLPVKENGVYLISGGAGKLGLIFARHFAKNYQAKLILLGRSELRDDQQQVLDELKDLGAEVVYSALDVTDLDAVNRLVQDVKQQFGCIDGIIHSAGIVDATPITELSQAKFNLTLAPKMNGALNLDTATKDEKLDFFVCFSSVSGVLGDLGAGSYAYANRFMDSFTLIRDQWRAQGKRHGTSISINWPLWTSGGMKIPEEEKAFFNFSGINGISGEEGLQAFETGLRSGKPQLLVATGNLEKMRRTFGIKSQSTVAKQLSTTPSNTAESAGTNFVPLSNSATIIASAAAEADVSDQHSSSKALINDNGLQKTVEHINTHLSAILKTESTSIDANASFESLGMDSVMLLEMQNSLKKDFERLPKTALFEYDTVSRLAGYLLANEKQTLSRLLGVDDTCSEPTTSSSDAVTTTSASASIHKGQTPAMEVVELPISTKSRSLIAARVPSSQTSQEGIAIIGMSGRFPQAPDMDAFWDNLQSGRNCITVVPQDRWEAEKYYSAAPRLRSNQMSSKWGGFIDGIDQFDPDFFRMSQTEAERADPQLRLLLETAWQALEDSSYTPSALAGTTVGTYIGGMNEDFSWIASEIYARTNEYAAPGSVASELANRLSYQFDFKGPSVTIQTACSSSMTSIHMARMAILGSECDMALAGGVNLSLHPSKYLLLQEMKVLSPDGTERTFDDESNGLVPSEGVGVVILKHLSKALEDGDHIYGVIKGSAISHSGVGAGQYLPNIKVMEETALKSIHQAGIDATDMTYIECHGTGTELGDPIELKALANAVSKLTDKKAFCALGTKANLGHMEAASGVCSLIKVLLSMKHKRLSPCANLSNVNTAVDIESAPFILPTAAEDWQPGSSGKYVAGINSFGLGGSTGFMVVESASDNEVSISPQDQQGFSVVLCSAKERAQTETYLQNLVAYLKRTELENMSFGDFVNFAYTTQLGRVHYNHRIAIVASGREDFIAKAERYLAKRASSADNGADNKVSTDSIYVGNTAVASDTLSLFNGHEGISFINSLVTSQKWKEIALLWTKGADINWSVLHQGNARKRMTIPTYPFAKKKCHINGFLKSKGICEATRRVIDTPIVDNIETVPAIQQQDVIKGQWYRASADTLDFEALIYGKSKSRTKRVRDANLKKYWLNYLGEETTNVAQLVAESEAKLIMEKNTAATKATLNIRLPEALTSTIQAFTQMHEIEVETLMIGVWAVLVSRYAKLKHSQLGVIKSLDASSIATNCGSDPKQSIAKTGRYAFPLKIKTAVRGSILNWLSELQIKMLEKNVFGQISLQKICKWAGIDVLFDSVVIFTDNQKDSGCTSTNDAELLHFSVPLSMHVNVYSSHVELTTNYKTACFSDDKIKTMLKHYVLLLEGVLQHPERNPAALSLQTKEEYRERFWKTLETNGER